MEGNELDQFVNQLIEDKNITGLTPEGREQVANELKELVTEEINRAVLTAMPDSKLDELSALMDSGDFTSDDMQKFIAESGVDLKQITTETLLYFRAFYLGNEQE